MCYVDFCVDLIFNLLGILSGKIEIYFKILVGFNLFDCLVYLIWLVFDEFIGNVK